MDTSTLDSITTTLAHAFSTPTKVRKFDHTSFVLHNLSKFVFQRLLSLQALHMSQYHDGIPSDHISRWHILLNILQASSIWSNISHTCESSYSPQRHQTYNYYEWSIHEHANHFSSHSASCVFLRLKPRYLSFANNQKSKREQQDTPTRAMAPLTHVNSDKIEVRLPCLICDLFKGMGMLLTKN
jgi:hypothetical protein